MRSKDYAKVDVAITNTMKGHIASRTKGYSWDSHYASANVQGKTVGEVNSTHNCATATEAAMSTVESMLSE
jgi:hypothetical protein